MVLSFCDEQNEKQKQNENEGIKKASHNGLLIFWWTRRESNPRPNKEFLSFLHAYSAIIFR